jgi:hypothetical protein
MLNFTLPLSSWRIPPGILVVLPGMVGFLEELTLVQKILRNPNYPGIPGGIDTCSKDIEKPKITQEFLAFLEELTPVQKMLRPTITQEFLVVLEELTLVQKC